MSANSSPEATWSRSRAEGFFGSIRRRVVLTIGASVVWLSGLLLFFAFWAGGFTLLQDIAVGVVSLVVLCGVLIGAWVSFGLRFLGRWD